MEIKGTTAKELRLELYDFMKDKLELLGERIDINRPLVGDRLKDRILLINKIAVESNLDYFPTTNYAVLCGYTWGSVNLRANRKKFITAVDEIKNSFPQGIDYYLPYLHDARADNNKLFFLSSSGKEYQQEAMKEYRQSDVGKEAYFNYEFQPERMEQKADYCKKWYKKSKEKVS